MVSSSIPHLYMILTIQIKLNCKYFTLFLRNYKKYIFTEHCKFETKSAIEFSISRVKLSTSVVSSVVSSPDPASYHCTSSVMIQITLPAATDQLAAHHGTHDTVSGDCDSEIVT